MKFDLGLWKPYEGHFLIKQTNKGGDEINSFLLKEMRLYH